MKKGTKRPEASKLQDREFSGYTFYISGLNAIIENQFELAVSYLTKAVEINSDIPEAFYHLGKLFFNNGDTVRAQKVFRDLLLRQNLSEALRNQTEDALIKAYTGNRQYYKAGQIATSRIKKYPYDNQIQRILIDLLERQNKFSQAEQYWRVYAKTQKISPKIRLALYCVESARVTRKISDKDKIVLLQKALRINSLCSPAYIELANIYKKSGKTGKVLDLWKKFLKNSPEKFPLIINDVNEYLFEINRYNELLQFYQTLTRIEGPFSIVVQAGLALHYLKTGNKELALNALSEMLKLDSRIPNEFKEMLCSYLKDNPDGSISEKLKKTIPDFINFNTYQCGECGKSSKKVLWHCPECGAWESFSLILH